MNICAPWILALACALNVGSLHAANQDGETLKVMSARLQNALDEFDQAPSARILEPVIEEVYRFSSAQEPESSVRSFKTRSLVRTLSVVEEKIDPEFDPND